MKLIKLLTNDPSINLASEYYYLTNDEFQKDDIIIFWKNKNTVVIGKNQSLASEVNQLYAKENNMKIVRRFSGGGSVYQDDGNICFTFIKRNKKKEFSFQKALQDIIEFLKHEDICAYFSGRNDILVNDKKVSGNAVYFYKEDYMIHGTLLFDVDIEKMVTVLTVDRSKLTSKGIESVKSRVLNLKDIYNGDIEKFENKFLNFFENKYKSKFELVDNTTNDLIVKIDKSIFNNNDWTYERDFDFNFKNSLKTKYGLISVSLKTEKNIIVDIEFYSDSLTALDLKELRSSFLNVDYQIENIIAIGQSIDLSKMLEEFTLDDLVKLFFEVGWKF